MGALLGWNVCQFLFLRECRGFGSIILFVPCGGLQLASVFAILLFLCFGKVHGCESSVAGHMTKAERAGR